MHPGAAKATCRSHWACALRTPRAAQQRPTQPEKNKSKTEIGGHTNNIVEEANERNNDQAIRESSVEMCFVLDIKN